MLYQYKCATPDFNLAVYMHTPSPQFQVRGFLGRLDIRLPGKGN